MSKEASACATTRQVVTGKIVVTVSVSILVAFVTVFDMIFICDIQWSVFVHVCPYLSMNIIGFAIAHRRAIVICLCIGVVAAYTFYIVYRILCRVCSCLC